MDLVRNGAKRSTIRAGSRQIAKGLATLVSERDSIPIMITKVENKDFGVLSDQDARTDGFENACDLKTALLRFYPSLTDGSPVTIVFFEPV